jgi:hypothetical protein
MTDDSNKSDVFSELYPLVIASLTGEITPAQVAQLEELVCSDPQIRQLYAQLIYESVNLRTWAELAREQTADELAMPDSVDRPRGSSMAVRWASAVAAASLLASLLVGWLFMSSTENESVMLSNQELNRETMAVLGEAQSVLDLLDELERENDTILQLLGQDADEEPIGDGEEQEPA